MPLKCSCQPTHTHLQSFLIRSFDQELPRFLCFPNLCRFFYFHLFSDFQGSRNFHFFQPDLPQQFPHQWLNWKRQWMKAFQCFGSLSLCTDAGTINRKCEDWIKCMPRCRLKDNDVWLEELKEDLRILSNNCLRRTCSDITQDKPLFVLLVKIISWYIPTLKLLDLWYFSFRTYCFSALCYLSTSRLWFWDQCKYEPNSESFWYSTSTNLTNDPNC